MDFQLADFNVNLLDSCGLVKLRTPHYSGSRPTPDAKLQDGVEVASYSGDIDVVLSLRGRLTNCAVLGSLFVCYFLFLFVCVFVCLFVF
jgi:hypothetical protein